MDYDIEDMKDIDKIYGLYMYALDAKFPLCSWEVSPGTFRISIFNWAGEEIDHTFLGEHAKEHRSDTTQELPNRISPYQILVR